MLPEGYVSNLTSGDTFYGIQSCTAEKTLLAIYSPLSTGRGPEAKVNCESLKLQTREWSAVQLAQNEGVASCTTFKRVNPPLNITPTHK
jgi:hypothetical protein